MKIITIIAVAVVALIAGFIAGRFFNKPTSHPIAPPNDIQTDLKTQFIRIVPQGKTSNMVSIAYDPQKPNSIGTCQVLDLVTGVISKNTLLSSEGTGAFNVVIPKPNDYFELTLKADKLSFSEGCISDSTNTAIKIPLNNIFRIKSSGKSNEVVFGVVSLENIKGLPHKISSNTTPPQSP